MKKLIVIAMFAAACGKGKGKSDDHALSDRAMMKLQDQVMGAKFDDAVKTTEGMLGPARAKDSTDWQYAAVEGDTCYQFGLMKDASGDKVSGVQNGSFKKGEAMYDDCAKMAVAKPAP